MRQIIESIIIIEILEVTNATRLLEHKEFEIKKLGNISNDLTSVHQSLKGIHTSLSTTILDLSLPLLNSLRFLSTPESTPWPVFLMTL